MVFVLAFLWGIVARLRNIRRFPSEVMIAWTDIRFSTDRVLLSTQVFLGLWLAAPFLDTFTSAVAYRKMAEIMPEFWWGFCLCFLSLLHIDSMTHSNLVVRRNLALAEMGMWIFMTWAFVVSNPAGLEVPVYALMAWHFYRIYKPKA